MFREELINQYKTVILPYWKALCDRKNGGFYGYVDYALHVSGDADKGVILNSRILWFFSEAYLTFHDKELLEYAAHAYDFLTGHCLDSTHGGVFWMLDCKGAVKEDMKHTYNQAFAIYALSAYYEASRNAGALKHAMDLFELVESKCPDEYGYREAFTVDWRLIENDKLSENGLTADKTMNTLLHLAEAYTQLYKVSGDGMVREKLILLLHIFKNKVYNPAGARLEVFFNNEMESISNLNSYGHDIEACWLLDRACKMLRDKGITESTGVYTRILAKHILETAFERDSIVNECFEGKKDKTRVWWVQAEAVVGFYNAYQKTGDVKYYDAACRIWQYIRKYFIDKRPGGEWYWDLEENGLPVSQKPITEPWKCPYHNGRMCFELVKRLSAFEEKKIMVVNHYNEVLLRENRRKENFYNGIYERWEYPVLTREHIPYFWKYDMDEKKNPYFMERLGVNAVFNAGALYKDGRYYLLSRVEGNDRKSFFAVAESESGVDHFHFRDYPVELPDTEEDETNVYDMRLTSHEDGYIYGVFCSESKDASSASLSAANAAAGIVRTRDLKRWERLPNLKTASPQQRNVVLHPEFIQGKYAFYTRPQDDFIHAGGGGGIGFALCEDIMHPSIGEERIISRRKYHTITEEKNGAGAVPIKTDRGWVHIAHGVRNTAAGLRYVIYAFASDLKEPWKVIAEPSGYLIAPLGMERVGDVSNVVFTNGAVVNEKGEVFIYYASDDTRLHVATTTVGQLVDYVFSTPEDPLRSAECVKQRCELIRSNLNYMGRA